MIFNSIFRPHIIIRMDGGICSQIAFLSLGIYLQHRGYKVKYDLSWYETCGLDDDHRFVRNFDLERAFPKLRIVVATTEEIKHYALWHGRYTTKRESYRAPLYIAGYPERMLSFVEAKDELLAAFHPAIDNTTEKLVEYVKACGHVCVVHVRRGDLAVAHIGYGAPPDVTYFKEAAARVASSDDKVEFLIFSDEPEWARMHIAPVMPNGRPCIVSEVNGSDKGYLDLYIMMHARHFITSQGSLGQFGAILGLKEDSVVVACRNQRWFSKAIPSVVLIAKSMIDDEYRENCRQLVCSNGLTGVAYRFLQRKYHQLRKACWK